MALLDWERSQPLVADAALYQPERALDIFQVLPRGMHYSADGASSIDLCVAELTRRSRHAATTIVFGEAGEQPLFASEFVRFGPDDSRASRVAAVRERARLARPHVVVVQQHLPTAIRVARALPGVPVVLHAHNFQRRSKHRLPPLAWLAQARRARAYGGLAGLIFVSEASLRRFAVDYPGVRTPRAVAPNGFEPGEWSPRAVREKEILFVGRADPDKGVEEAAEAVAAVLPEAPGWRATFILSAGRANPACMQRVRALLAPCGDRAAVVENVPHAAVREANARAAIALVPSKWVEPFGRTALEAHAGGAALISSGSGGLAEISGDAALMLDAVTPSAIAGALRLLIADPGRRAALARAGRSRVLERFAADAVAARMDAFLADVAAARAPAWRDRPAALA